MAGHPDVYRAFVRLYPRSFRDEFADDLVQHFGDLLASHGPSRTWGRTALDLVVTVPRYRLETVMSPGRSHTVLALVTVLVAGAAVAVLLTGIPGGVLLLLAAAVLVVASLSGLARSTRPPDTERRRHLLTASAILAVTCVVSTTLFWIDLGGDESWDGGKLTVYNGVFFASLAGAIVCLIAGLRTPRTPPTPALEGTIS